MNTPSLFGTKGNTISILRRAFLFISISIFSISISSCGNPYQKEYDALVASYGGSVISNYNLENGKNPYAILKMADGYYYYSLNKKNPAFELMAFDNENYSTSVMYFGDNIRMVERNLSNNVSSCYYFDLDFPYYKSTLATGYLVKENNENYELLFRTDKGNYIVDVFGSVRYLMPVSEFLETEKVDPDAIIKIFSSNGRNGVFYKKNALDLFGTKLLAYDANTGKKYEFGEKPSSRIDVSMDGNKILYYYLNESTYYFNSVDTYTFESTLIQTAGKIERETYDYKLTAFDTSVSYYDLNGNRVSGHINFFDQLSYTLSEYDSYDTYDDDDSVYAMPREYMTYEGTIDGKYGFVMEINVGIEDGSYYYKSNASKTQIPLTFVSSEKTSSTVCVLKLTEHNNSGKQTGVWDVTLRAGESMKGTFTNSSGKVMSVSAKQVF